MELGFKSFTDRSLLDTERVQTMLGNKFRRANHLPGNRNNRQKRKNSSTCGAVPPARPDNGSFGILYGTVQLPIFQNPFGVICGHA